MFNLVDIIVVSKEPAASIFKVEKQAARENSVHYIGKEEQKLGKRVS
jgi:hypothetical protein